MEQATKTTDNLLSYEDSTDAYEKARDDYKQYQIDTGGRISNTEADKHGIAAQNKAQDTLSRQAERESIIKQMEGMIHEASLYHHVCYGTQGVVRVQNHWGYTECWQCDIPLEHLGIKSCLAGADCPHDGIIRGFIDLTDSQRAENFLLNKIIESLKH